eukprot:1458572-Ditylum_brightwellii.AAC.1
MDGGNNVITLRKCEISNFAAEADKYAFKGIKYPVLICVVRAVANLRDYLVEVPPKAKLKDLPKGDTTPLVLAIARKKKVIDFLKITLRLPEFSGDDAAWPAYRDAI